MKNTILYNINEKLYNRYEKLKQREELLEFCHKEHYKCESEENREILYTQTNRLKKYMNCEEMALIFMEGLEPENKKISEWDKEIVLASYMNSFFASLLFQQMIYYREGIRSNSESSLKDTVNKNNKNELIVSLSLYIDNKMIVTLEQMTNEDINIKRYMFEWYQKRLDQIEKERRLLEKESIEEKESGLRKIWEDDSYISSYRLGRNCFNRKEKVYRMKDESMIKEFEFWLSCRWLGKRIECNSIFSDYINDEKAKDRMNELRDYVTDYNLQNIFNFYCNNLNSLT